MVYDLIKQRGTITINIIAEHIYSKLDGDGYGTTLLDEIIDHRSDDSAVQKEDGGQQGPNGETTPRQTTKGWWLLVRMKDHSTEWYKLKDIKQSNPLEVAQYAVDNKLEEEPAFRWWVPFTIRKRNRILKAMTNRYHRTVQKFGIELPKTVERALEIDKETNTTFWRDAINKEMKTVKVAFQFLPEGAAKPVGREYIGCHLVFDVKQGTLQRKCRFVAEGQGQRPLSLPMLVLCPGSQSGLLLPWLHSMDWMSWQLTVKGPTSMQIPERSSIPSVALSLGLSTRGGML